MNGRSTPIGDDDGLKARLDAFPTQLVLTLVWIALGVPSILWWRDSVPWVVFMSLYAIVVSHWTGHMAWKAERAAEG